MLYLSNTKTYKMKAQFELKSWLTENREMVISKFDSLTAEKFYNGVTLKSFMIEVYNACVIQGWNSIKTAERMLPHMISQVYLSNSSIGVSYSTPYSSSNHAKAVNYHGKEKVAQMSR